MSRLRVVAPSRTFWNMGEGRDVTNNVSNGVSGHVNGPVVQAGSINGNVILPATPSPEEADLRARWAARTKRILDAEDAERAVRYAQSQFQKQRFLKKARRGIYGSVVWILFGMFLVVGGHGSGGDSTRVMWESIGWFDVVIGFGLLAKHWLALRRYR